ncbi:hypothetical protein [uncultured Maribacter sp.]|uniref:hypothetical protein n=1 Tax=uncultured Maribacter sp. TaxID=431308 RepID=UPI002634F193|nr:hypothetical protein [uncultured Maribacter sp.]
MENQKEIKLSSNWTNFGAYISLIISLMLIPLFYFLFKQEPEFHVKMLIFGAIIIAIVGLAIYQFLFSSDARIVDDKLILKKIFRPSKSYSFDKIGYPSSFQWKRTKYITIEMVNEDKSLEKYLIINNSHLLAFENKDAESALISLRGISRGK